MIKKILYTLLFIIISLPIYSQFGQNKVMYDQFDFSIYNTPRFEIYNYVKNDTVLLNLGQLSERWYLRHYAMFGDSLENSPIILYNNAADFMQTTVISGIIGVGTGGVTEGFRSRVMIPLMVSNKETDHVLGHEMVHVFQYNIVRESDSLSFQNLANVPLWMIEGMAEFLSIGSSDNRTAMWMRDAVINDDVPSLKDMTRKMGEYFPYRYGHAFWAYVTGTWGDNILKPYYYLTLKYGIDNATQMLMGFDTDSLSVLWQESFKTYYPKFLTDTLGPVGKLMFNSENSGEINLTPVLSPDGKYMTFLSNKNVIDIDLLLANTKTNKVEKKLTSSLRKSHIDDFNYVEEAGSWSPSGNQYVITTFTQGKNKLLIINFNNYKVYSSEEIEIPGVDAIINPEWSPDGKTILFNGLVSGKSDLYLYHIDTKKTEQLTNDYHSDLQPSWSADGSEIAFISDRGPDSDIEKQIYGSYRLCVLKRKTGQIITYDLFPGANIFSPQYSPTDSSLYFLSNADGFRNLYRYHLHTGEVFKLTKFATGISGITDLAPAYSVSRKTGQVAYTLYKNDNYEIYLANPEEFLKIPVDPTKIDLSAEYLAPGKNRIFNIVDHNLHYSISLPEDSFKIEDYNPKFKLEYIGSNGMGVGYSTYGTFVSGGVSLLFSDMLKHHQIYTMININGEIYDFGGQLAYINNANRISWGASFSHLPYRTMYYTFYKDPESGYTFVNYDLVRIYEENLSLFSQLPLSSKLRFEGGISYARYSYRIDSINLYFNTKTKVENVPDPFNVGSAYIAFVGDNANFGITSPLSGWRYRFQVGQMFDRYDLTNINIDIRKYFYQKPLGIAFKFMHYGRYGKSANDLYPIYLGNDFLIRGYNFATFNKSLTTESESALDINHLVGSKVLVFNSELRVPFTGIQRLSLIKSGYLFSDLVFFFDAGLSWAKDKMPWDRRSDVRFSWNPDYRYYTPIFSAGASIRINLFGMAILEPYIALPFQLSDVDYSTGFIIHGGGF